MLYSTGILFTYNSIKVRKNSPVVRVRTSPLLLGAKICFVAIAKPNSFKCFEKIWAKWNKNKATLISLSSKLETKVTPSHFLCLSTFLVKMDGQRDVEGAQWPYFTKNCQMSKTYCPNNMSLFSMNKMHFQDLQSFPATYHFLKFHSNYTKCTLPKNKIN